MLRLLAAVTLVATLAAPPEDDRGRPVVLLVHGRGMVGRDTAAMRKMWFDAIASGTTPGSRPLIAERDVRVVWYADVLDPRSTASCSYASGDARARRDAATSPELKELVATAGSIITAITNLVDDSEAGAQLRSLSADAAFLSDSRKRCASEQRLGDALDRARREGRPVILVAHSLGALVAYDYLSSRADTAIVDRFITIGSPAGAPELRRLLIGGDEADTLSRPRAVKSWINIRNENDWFAAPISIGRDVLTTAPSDEPDPHEMVGYLRGAAANTEVVGGWCALFTSKAPEGCASVRRPAP